ncbi:MAG: hypothetical protein AB7G87_01135 [Clostridia bacterium]
MLNCNQLLNKEKVVAILLSNGDIVQRREEQFFQMGKSQEFWELWGYNGASLERLAQFNKNKVQWVFDDNPTEHDINESSGVVTYRFVKCFE